MRLKRSGVVVPLLIGVVISFAFLMIQGHVFDVIGWNYNVCHALFGFTFPFFMSYFSFERSDIKRLALNQTFARVSAIRWFYWPLALIRSMGRSIARDFREGVSWKPSVSRRVVEGQAILIQVDQQRKAATILGYKISDLQIHILTLMVGVRDSGFWLLHFLSSKSQLSFS